MTGQVSSLRPAMAAAPAGVPATVDSASSMMALTEPELFDDVTVCPAGFHSMVLRSACSLHIYEAFHGIKQWECVHGRLEDFTCG